MPTDRLADPAFQQLSPSAKKIVLERDDPSFARLSPAAKELVLQRGIEPPQPRDMTLDEFSGLADRPGGTFGAANAETGDFPKTDDELSRLLTPPSHAAAKTVSGMAKQALPSMTGGAIGTIVGAATGPAAPIAIPALMAIGSSAGEYVGQKMGVNPRSNLDVLLAGALPLGIQAATGAGRQVVGKLAKSSAGGIAAQQDDAVKAARRMAGRMGPKTDPKTLIPQLERQQAQIPLVSLRNTVDDLAKKELVHAPGHRKADLMKEVQIFRDRYFSMPGGQPTTNTIDYGDFQKVWADIQDINEKLRLYEPKGGRVHQAFARLRSAFADDLDRAARTAPAGQAADDLSRFNALYKRKVAQEEFKDLLKLGGGIVDPRKGDPNELVSINATKLIKALQKNTVFQRAFDPGEYRDYLDTLRTLRTIPPLAPLATTPHGSGPTIKRIVGAGLAGAGIGFGTGGTSGAAIGAGIGLAATSGIGDMVSDAMQSRGGRAMLRKLYSKGFHMDAGKSAQLAQFLRAQGGADDQPSNQFQDLESMLNASPQLRGNIPEPQP